MTSLKKLLTLAAIAAAAGAQAQTSKADLDSVQRAVHVCASCHGENGNSTKPLIPSLAGQMREYTIRQLKDFRSQSRSETDIQAYMWGISALLSDEQIEGFADYYAAQKPAPGKSTNPKLEAAGKALYDKGLPDKGVLPCKQCHGDNAEGASGFPRLAGQKADYVYKQLQAFRTPLRPHGVVMKNEIAAMTPQQLKAVAAYVQSR
jgi:cytochrome c553